MKDAITLLAEIAAVSTNGNSEPDAMAAALDNITKQAREFMATADTLPALDRANAVQPVCCTCGSTEVTADASAEWDRDQQRWSINNVYDKGHYCSACDGECDIEHKPLAEIAACQDCGCEWHTHSLNDIEDVEQRVEPGEPMPVGECPGKECGGALCQLVCEELREIADETKLSNYPE